MYCSGCGTELPSDLNYCNRCGNRVAKSESTSVAENLSQAISYIGGFGLLGFIFGVYLMVRAGVVASVLMGVSFLYLATLFGICYLILRQTAPFAARKRDEPGRERDEVGRQGSLRPLTTAQLPEPDHRTISVTENTTRTFDKIPVARK